MVSESKDEHNNVARMPSSAEMLLDPENFLLPLQQLSSSLHHKEAHHIPTRSNSRARRQKFCLANSPHLRPPTLRHLKSSGDDSSLAPPILSQNSSQEILRPCLSRKPSARKLPQRRTQSREQVYYTSEADFLVQNHHLFTQEDLQAVLAALAEESLVDERVRKQEEESMLLAQELAIQFSEDTLSKQVSEEESILLATELVLNDREMHLRSSEEESILLARELAMKDSDEPSWEKASAATAMSNVIDRESILLAQELAIAAPRVASRERHSTGSIRSCANESNQGGLEALIVALRAELDESANQFRGEQESYRLACQLVSEGAAVMHQDGEDATKSSMGDWLEGQNFSGCHFQPVQCQVCHFDIADKETLRDLPCGHCFHTKCINRWFLTDRVDCPCCRRHSIA